MVNPRLAVMTTVYCDDNNSPFSRMYELL